jgi:hypothetical protein
MFCPTVVVPVDKVHTFEVGTVADYLRKVQEPLPPQEPEPVEATRPRMTLRALLGLEEGLTMSQAFA